MNIVVIGRFGPEAFGGHISETLSEMGHNAFHCDPLLDVPVGWYDPMTRRGTLGKIRGLFVKEMLSREAYAKALTAKIAASLHGGDCDLILTTHDFVSPVAFEQLRKRFSAKITLWFPDHIARLEKAFMLSGLYDTMFFKDPFFVQRIRDELGLDGAHYLPECCNPVRHSLPDSTDVAEEHDLGTAGNMHPSRAVVIRQLLEKNHKLTVWGPPVPGWMKRYAKNVKSKPFVADEEKAKAFRSCKIVLNTVHPAEVEGTNVRTFEAAAAGAFQLATYRHALGDLFNTETEIATYRTTQELLEKIDYYLPRPEERQQIAARARQRALAEHTYKHRLQTILNLTGLGTTSP